MLIATLYVVLLGLLAAFQLVLALGAPLGRFAWGGRHPRALPARLRVGSVVSIVLYAAFAVVALGRVGALEWASAGFWTVAMWIVFAIQVLAILPNAASRSKPERYLMTPVAVVLAVLALLIAIG